MANILVIDDDRMICEAFAETIEPMGHNIQTAQSLSEGLKKILTQPFDLVFLDVRLPDGNGLAAVPEIRKVETSPDIVIITGEGDPDGAELAIKSGCWDYIMKPISADAIRLPLFRVLQYRSEKQLNTLPVSLKREGIIGNSPKLKECLDLVAKVGKTETHVLLKGETGTGKELFARVIHDNSRQAGREFVVVDCASLPESLVESILFGHEKGAFTGADQSQKGLIKQADGGTLFLDEVGELPISIQGAFLRVIQEGSFRPIGGKREIKSDFRLIAATNRDLDLMVNNGSFRSDLLFRLRSVVIDLPPLRERVGDIKNIALFYISKFSDRYGLGTKGFSPEFLEVLNTYQWPGNVRELINALERALSVAHGEQTLFPIHLPNKIRSQLIRASLETNQTNGIYPQTTYSPEGPFTELKTLIESVEKKYFQDLIAFTEGDIKKVCRISGLSRAQVYRLLNKHEITRRF